MVHVHLFTRDLRLYDHPALLEIEGDSLALFIFTPQQVSSRNRYRSLRSISFMVQSLNDLDQNLRRRGGTLAVGYGEECEVLTCLSKTVEMTRLTVTEDWTPYAVDREKRIAEWAEGKGIPFQSYRDLLLEEDPMTGSGNPYQVFTSFHKRVRKNKIPQPDRSRPGQWMKMKGEKWDLSTIVEELEGTVYDPVETPLAGGRQAALAHMRSYDWKDYERDCLDSTTTQMSAHNHYGTVSIREVYHWGENKQFREGLYWREFHYYLSRHWKEYYQYDHLFKEAQGSLSTLWRGDRKRIFAAWKKGQTGIPVVDAIMRQLEMEGWIANRHRLIVGESVKLFGFPWEWAEKYFTRQLVDIDRAQNMGNWNWVSSFGLDRARFLRIFNPWKQGEDHDPQGEYIHRWIPELGDVPAEDLHRWDKCHGEYEVDYPPPIIDYAKERGEFKKRWDSLFRSGV